MKKKIVAIMLAGMLAVSFTACGDSGDTSGENDTTQEADNGADATTDDGADTSEETEPEASEPEDDGVINFDGTGYNVTYVKHETGTDYEENPCLYYYYTFTNTGDENASPMSASYIQCFQNGVQCETAITMESNDSIDNYMLEVQPGGSLEVCEVFSISDTSDVTIEASDLISFDDAKDTQVITLE